MISSPNALARTLSHSERAAELTVRYASAQLADLLERLVDASKEAQEVTDLSQVRFEPVQASWLARNAAEAQPVPAR